MCRQAPALQKVMLLPDGRSDPDRDTLFIGNRSCNKHSPFLSREMQAAALENVIDGTQRAQNRALKRKRPQKQTARTHVV